MSVSATEAVLLLSSTAEAMYWMGRYCERAQALARTVGAYERLSLDSSQGEPLDPSLLLPLVDRAAARSSRPTRKEVLRLLVLDAENPSSVRGALGAARENLRSGRTVMPASAWMPVNRLHARLSELHSKDTAGVFGALEEVEAIGSQLEGRIETTMMRDAAFSFWRIGSCLERADMLLRTLGVLAPALVGGGDRRFADVRAGGLLDCVGASSMFRRLHQTNRELETMLAFLLNEAAFPRSLKALLFAVERELERLPRSGAVQAALRACFAPAHAAELSAEPAALMLENVCAHLEELGDAVAATYFPVEHRRTVAERPAEVASLPPAQDPFEALGREHAAVEAVLRLVDEITARAECGQAVDRSAVRAVCDFFTDFGVLGHHEKEESILMPVLVNAGFDWQDGPLADIRRDHRQEHYFLRVLTHLAGQRTAWSSEDLRRFVEVAREFTQFLRAHMRLEQREVFEPAARKLSAQVKASLLEDLARFDAQTGAELRLALERVDGLLSKYNVATHARAPGATGAPVQGRVMPERSPPAASIES
ncbi:MAG TPA: alpha-E domain-containing protein [Polyangiaceae bacterium]|nr:alpha-E domain-containing protein [Polyangiaceae bacterium]